MSRCPDNHSKRILQALNQNRKCKNLCDGLVKINETLIPVQRCVLAAASHYFKLVFEDDGKGTSISSDGKATVNISSLDVSVGTFSVVLDYIYTSDIQLQEDSIQDVLQAADLLLLVDLKALCCEFLEGCISCHNCLGIIEFCMQFSCPWVKYKATKFFDENFSEVSHSEEFLQLSFERLKFYLQRDTLTVASESEVFRAVLRWVMGDEEQRKDRLCQIIQECLRTSLMTKEEFVGTLKVYVSQEDRMFQDFVHSFHQGASQRRKPRGVIDALVFTGGNEEESTLVRSDVKSFVQYKLESGQSIEGWTDLVPIHTPRSHHSSALVGGCLYVVGGRNERDQTLNSAEKYDPSDNKWHIIAPMHCGRYDFGLVAVDGKLYAFGGLHNSLGVLSSVEEYDIYKNEWRECPDMKLPREWACHAVIDKTIYVIGGGNRDQFYEMVECFDTRNHTWSSAPPLIERRTQARAVTIGDEIYVFGGFRTFNCPSSYRSQPNLRFCPAEVFSRDKNAWTRVYPVEPQMCSMSSNNEVTEAMHYGNEIWVCGNFELSVQNGYGVSYPCLRGMDSETGGWYTVTYLPTKLASYSCCVVQLPRHIFDK